MAIEKNSLKASRLDYEFSCRSRESMSSEDDLQRPVFGSDIDDDDEFDDCDSGAGSDDFDLLELGEGGEEFCQIGDQRCSVPYELYDLSGLDDILSMDVWNDVLTDDDRLSLAKHLPDMDQENFMQTMKELFTGCNLYFGSPVTKLFEMLKGGLCEPRVALYRQGLSFFQKRQHCHAVRKYHNSMVANICQIRDAWLNCRGYSIEEKLRVLNIVKSQKSLMYEKMEELETDSSEKEEESGDGLWINMKLKDWKQKKGQNPKGTLKALEPAKIGKQNPKGTLKVSGSKMPTAKMSGDRFPSVSRASAMKSGAMHEVSIQREPKFPRIGSSINGARTGKKYEGLISEEYTDSFSSLSLPLTNDLHSFGRSTAVNRLSDIKVLTANPSGKRFAYDYGEKHKNAENVQKLPIEEQLKLGKLKVPQLSLRGSQVNFSDWSESLADPLFKHVDLNAKSKKGKTVKGTSNLKVNKNPSEEKRMAISMKNGQRTRHAKGEETESDSSEQLEEDGDDADNPLMRSKWAYPSGAPNLRAIQDVKKGKSIKKDKRAVQSSNGSSQTSRHKSDFTKLLHLAEGTLTKAKQKGKTDDVIQLNNSNIGGMEDDYMLGPSRFNGESHQDYPSGKRQKREIELGYSAIPLNYLDNFVVEDPNNFNNGAAARSDKKGQQIEAYAHDHSERSSVQLLSCNSVSKKRKLKDKLNHFNEEHDPDYLHTSPQPPLDDDGLQKRGKRKSEDEPSLEKGNSEPPIAEMVDEDILLESKTQKKPFTLITPTVHTGFSFSIIHLLSAVRMAMVTLLPEDSADINEQILRDDQVRNQESNNGASELNAIVPSLSVQEIVNRVRSNPGDPCILETQEPLQDLVRGVLKIFASKTAPLGAKGWKPLVLYEKSRKTWSWIGPVIQNSSDPDGIEEVTSPDSWGLTHKMLVKLVDSFANWLKSGQETLQQIGSLPAPPLTLMQLHMDEKERFRDLRAQKSLNTINPSSEEVRAYFRKEEVLRYSIPDRAFSYTAVDGRKSIVAPLRRCGGKPTSKAREHFMLKKDRPPHVTILCLVRDAAARLPGSIGTRADVCTLIRDSQFVVEDVSDAQVNQIVSGALDRLHYERDPCVQFDGDRKLWVYLHREREEEDFEDDGTTSTKKWKRQKKESNEGSDMGGVTAAYHSEHTGFDLSSDLNVEASGVEDDKRDDLLYYDERHHFEDNFEKTDMSDHGIVHRDSSMGWESLGYNNPMTENKLLCQENSTNEDFDDDPFGRGGPDELLGSGFS